LTYTGSISGIDLNTKIVTTGWLRSNLENEKIRVMDVRPQSEYGKSHICGAVYIDIEQILDTDTRKLDPVMLMEVLGKSGIDENATIIIYGNSSDWRQFYLLWSLDYIGHTRSAILDGGYGQWKKEERPLSQNPPAKKIVKYRNKSIFNSAIRASLYDLKKPSNGISPIVISIECTKGVSDKQIDMNGPVRKKACIRCWTEDVADDGSWKNPEILKSAYAALGLSPSSTVVVTSDDGCSSAISWFTLKYVIGFSNVKNFDGSEGKWADRESVSVQMGMQ